MRKSRLWKRFCIIAFALLILILFFFGYDRINQKYPQAAVEIVGMEEPIETDGVETALFFIFVRAHLLAIFHTPW